MIDTHELKKRDLYLNKIIAFQDTEPVKVVTGIRRCGKSSLLKLMTLHLKETGITDNQILEMNFESHKFKNMTSDSLYEYVKQHIQPDKRMYLFFDEVQRVPNWEDAINSFRIDFNCDIYVTGSNAYMLSSEYATYLSGRCVEIKMLPLSFSEFLTFHDFEIRETKSALGGTRKQAFDKTGEHYELREVFDAYMRFGGMPGIADVGLDQEKALVLLEGIYSTVIMRDILERENRRGQKRITDPVLLKKIVMFLADNIGSSISVSSIGNTLVNEGLLEDPRVRVLTSEKQAQLYGSILSRRYASEHPITEEQVRNRYDSLLSSYDPHEIKFRHILVKTLEEAREIIQSLKVGSDFGSLAKERSLDQNTSQNGGQIPFTNIRNVLVPGLAEAILALQPGDLLPVPFKSS